MNILDVLIGMALGAICAWIGLTLGRRINSLKGIEEGENDKAN